jgi:hypothetical protein
MGVAELHQTGTFRMAGDGSGKADGAKLAGQSLGGAHGVRFMGLQRPSLDVRRGNGNVSAARLTLRGGLSTFAG